MSLKPPFASLLFLVTLIGLAPAARADAPTVVMNDSIRVVEQSSEKGAVDVHRPFISRSNLSAQETSAPMTIELPLKMRNFADLEARVARGEHITPQEFVQKYEPAAADLQTVAAWAKGQGLTLTRQDDHNLAVFARGSVSQVAGALGVKFARVTYRGKEFTSAVNAPSLPGALSNVVLGVSGLQPHLRPHKHLLKQVKNAVSGSAQYVPSQIATAYNVTSLYNNNISGSGQTIAIVIDTFPATSDLVQFWSTANVSQSLSNIQFIQTVPGQLPDPSGEETLDTEWASGMAPNAHVRVYAATDLGNTDLDTTYQQVIDDATNHPEYNIHQMTMSFGSSEPDTSASELDNDHQLFTSLTGLGVTCFASSGDGGSTPDDQGGEAGAVDPENPASDPSVTGVGGTSLVLNSNNSVSSETVWNDDSGATGGGTSAHFARPSWQTGTGVNTSAKRQVPDIAATADPQFGGVVILGGQEQVFGGTSLASPICAALNSLVNEERANLGMSPVGLLNADIYSFIGTSDFRDITSGNNFTPNSPNKYAATTGYDECTGVGVPLATTLAKALGSSTLVGARYPAAMQEVAPGATATFGVAVSNASASYQWQRCPVGGSSFSNLSDGSGFSGSSSATLTISNASTSLSGDQYQCVVNLGAATVTTSPPSNLAVETPLAVTPLAGRSGSTGSTNGSGTGALFNYPSGIAVVSTGNLYVADFSNNQIRMVTPQGVVTTPFGSLSRISGSTNGSGNSALFNSPNGIAADSSDNLYVADSGNNRVRKIVGTTVSNTGANFSFNNPQNVAVDRNSGNVYVADYGNNTVDVITPGGTASVFAGVRGSTGFRDGSSGQALFDGPQAVAVDSSGNVWVADMGNSVIREISNGTVTTIAGTGGTAGYLDGAASSALFNNPIGLAFDSSNTLYIADSLVTDSTSNAEGNCVLRKLSPSGAVTTLAGDPGVFGSAIGTGSAAKFSSIQAVASAANGVYVADTYNQVIRGVGTGSSGGGGNTGTTTATVALSNLNTTYTGSPQTVTTTTNPSGLTVNVTYNGSATAPTNAGSYAVVATISSSTFTGSTSGTFVIGKATGTVTLSNLSLTYNGSQQTATVTTTPSGLTTNVTYNNSAAAPANAGTYTVFAQISDANYTGFSQSQLVIAKAPATVTLGNLSVNYNGSAQAATATTNPSGLAVSFTYNGSTKAPSAAGSYTVVGTISNANFSGSNTGTLVISQGVPTITLGGLNVIFNGKPHAATATTMPSGLPVTFTYNGISSAPTAVGSYNVVATVNTTNYAGTQNGTLVIAPVPPVAVTGVATAITANGATLNGTVNPEGSATVVGFQYGTNTSYTGGTVSAGTTGTGSVAVAVSAGIAGLNPGTLYHYRVVAQANGTTVNGADKTFTTLAAPAFASTSQSLLAASGAQLIFGVNPDGVATTVHFIYSTDPNFGTFSQTAAQSIGAGKVSVNVVAFLSGLAANTTYYYEVVTVSAAGTFTSQEESFTTLGFDVSEVAATGTGTYATLGNAATDVNDGVAFRATLTGAATASNTGIFANENSAAFTLMAQTGATAPGTGGATFATLTDPVYNDNEDVAFGGTLKVATGLVTSATANGLWASSGGTVNLLARAGSTAPGAGSAAFAAFSAMGLSNNAGAVFAATLTGTGVTSANNAGVWEGSASNSLALMLRTGEQVTDTVTNATKTIASFKFLPVESVVNGQTRGFDANGDLVANTSYVGGGTGIVLVTQPLASGAATAVATSGDPAPGTAAPASATFASFGNAAINDSDHVAFAAALTVGTGETVAANAGGVWADAGTGTLELRARLGETAPGTAAGGTFASFGDPVDNSNDAVAFRATLAGATTATASGIWCDSTGALDLVAQQGGHAPGCATGVTFSAFTELALNDNGGVMFLATLAGTGVTAANNVGIFAQDNTGALQLIVRTGDSLGGKTVTVLTFLPAETLVNGQARSFTPSTGDLVFNATFSDKSQGIFDVVFP